MSLYSDEIDKHYILDDLENKLKRKSSCWSFKSMKSDEDKRARREVANNNERRRMQSINAGFENLRKLLPHCVENEKISKASILQTTAKYILELKTRINSLENDILQANPGIIKCTSPDVHKCTDDLDNAVKTVKQNVYDQLTTASQLETAHQSTVSSSSSSSLSSSYMSDLGSSSSSLVLDNLSSSTISLKSCDTDMVVPVIDNYQPATSTFDHLLAAVAQVERQEAMESGGGGGNDEDRGPLRDANTTDLYEVMKPTISPYAEKIIKDVATMQHRMVTPQSSMDTPQQQYRSSKIAIPHKYLHRPEVVLCRSKNS